MRILLIALLTTFFTYACNMHQDIVVDLPQHTPVTFVECYLEPGAPARVLATQSVAFFDSVEIKPVDGLDIHLYRNGELVPLTNTYQIDSFYHSAYNYVSSEEIEYDANAVWELIVHREEKEIARAVTKFLPKPIIKGTRYTLSADSILSLEIQVADDPGQDNYYKLYVHHKGMLPSSGFKGIWTDQAAENGMLNLKTGPEFRLKNDSVVVSLYHIDKAHYNFLRSLEKASNANYNPFAQPANIESNLKGEAMGLFTTLSSTTYTIKVEQK